MLKLSDIEAQYPEAERGLKYNLLREYLQYKILELLFNSAMGHQLAFLGGTAIRIAYKGQRFSEDLDFDNFDLKDHVFRDSAASIKESLKQEGLQAEIQTLIENKTFHYKIKFPAILFGEPLSGHPQEKILIKIDTEPQGFVYQPRRILLNKFDVFTEVYVTPPDILLSQKITAIFKRTRPQGRDFYDLVFLRSLTKPNFDFLTFKLNITNSDILKKALLEKIKVVNLQQLAKDVEPFVFSKQALQRIIKFETFVKEML